MDNTTLLVLKLSGPIFAAMGLGMLLNLKYYKKMFNELSNSPISAVFIAMSSALMGLLIVLNHNLWSTAPEVVVSLLGWVALVKGAVYFLIPVQLAKLGKSVMNTGLLSFGTLLILVLGGYMTYVGFFV